ncbi:trypsin-like serine protease [Xinfangfangia sp. CPCC 101601]|uniref:Serine protease n=1 Tax=Pseudogemmobacter lacusdianii TaxID=3069608 RepID=A0ABU0W0L4_9RHOB|nr:trypsin-like serine protease [Xinfangfangia sp. CPCC 101601]MDQ2067433.1 trypsin-like serine protease [Xinfangfangia sp. CPCC 101601]
MFRLKPLMIASVFTLFAGTALPEEGAVTRMHTANDARGWNSVGKLMMGQRGFCTGVLIAPARVLTAAHCLFDKETGARMPDDQISFQAGWRNGRAEAYRGVRRSIAHPDFIYSGEDDMARVAYDLALLELDQPILLPQLTPFAIDNRPGAGDHVSVVSYAKDRSEVPSIEQDCRVIINTKPALILSCDIDFGSSGAPVFTVQDGVARVVSVISAKAEMEGNKVALAVPLEQPLAQLQEAMDQDAPGERPRGPVKVLKGGLSGGAKFITP